MSFMLLRRAAFFLVVLVLAAAPALAQQPSGTRIVGRIAHVSGSEIAIKTVAGKTVTVALAPDATVTQAVPAKLSDIKPGSFVGTAARPEAYDRWRAIEVHVFPPGSRLGEGHRPWNPEPGATMTNADVTAAVVRASAGAMTLTTGGQNYAIDVPRGTPIVAMSPGTPAQIKVGARISIGQAVPAGANRFTAKSITVSTNPHWPPK